MSLPASSLQAASLFRVDGIVAVVTGGGTGLGLVMARALALNGAKRVFILGRRGEVLQASAAKVNAEVTGTANGSALAAGPLVPIVCDVGSQESLQAAVDTVTADPVAQGCINLLISNAGTYGNLPHEYAESREPIGELRNRLFNKANMADFNNVLRVNVAGAMFTVYAFLELLDNGNKRALRESDAYGAPTGTPSTTNPGSHPRLQSQIIMTMSIGSFTRHGRLSPAYVASKAALLQMTKQLSTSLAPYSIRANGLAPGLFPSDMTGMLMENRDPETETPDDIRYIPALKFGGADNMSGSVLYLASSAGSFCNGLILLVDGGRLSRVQSSY